VRHCSNRYEGSLRGWVLQDGTLSVAETSSVQADPGFTHQATISLCTAVGQTTPMECFVLVRPGFSSVQRWFTTARPGQ
jgi:hypothetical protein